MSVTIFLCLYTCSHESQVQDIVVGNKNFTDVTKPSEIVQLLLNDEQLASLESSNRLPGPGGKTGKEKSTGQDSMRDLWNEEGDDFFGHSTGVPADKANDDTLPAASQSTRGKRRKTGTTGATRGRKQSQKKKVSATADISIDQ